MPGPRRQRAPAFVGAIFVLALTVAACGSAASPSPSPTPRPTPTPTPNPHLVEPTTADAVYAGLRAAGLTVTANTAVAAPSGEPRKTISATYAGWPLLIIEFSNRAALQTSAGKGLAIDEAGARPPYAFLGLNVAVAYGPAPTSATGSPPAAAFRVAAGALVGPLDALIGPLLEQAAIPVPLPSGGTIQGAAPSPTASGSGSS